MTYVKTQLPTLKTHVVNLKRDAKDLSRDLQRLEVRGKLGSKTLFYLSNDSVPPRAVDAHTIPDTFPWRHKQLSDLVMNITLVVI